MKLLLNLNFVPSYCPHDHDARKLVIGKDDWPVEFIIGRPIQNFLRRFIHGDHFECHTCYEKRRGIKVQGGMA